MAGSPLGKPLQCFVTAPSTSTASTPRRSSLSRPSVAACSPTADGRVAKFVALNPQRGDRHLGSFKINLKTGVWADFASGDKGSDPVSLVAFIEDCRQGEAALKLARMLGLDGGGRRHG